LVRLVIALNLAATALFSAESSVRFTFSNFISGAAPFKATRHANYVSYPTFLDELQIRRRAKPPQMGTQIASNGDAWPAK